MTRCRIEPTGPGTVDACGLSIPSGGIEQDLDQATLALLSGDARVTVTPVDAEAEKTPPAPPKKASRRR